METAEKEADGQKFAIVERAEIVPTMGMASMEPMPRGRERVAGLDGRIAEQRLQPDGQDDQASIEAEAKQGHQKDAYGIGARFEHAQAHDGVRRLEFAPHESDEEDATTAPASVTIIGEENQSSS